MIEADSWLMISMANFVRTASCMPRKGSFYQQRQRDLSIVQTVWGRLAEYSPHAGDDD